jgi:hypothetical protein
MSVVVLSSCLPSSVACVVVLTDVTCGLPVAFLLLLLHIQSVSLCDALWLVTLDGTLIMNGIMNWKGFGRERSWPNRGTTVRPH